MSIKNLTFRRVLDPDKLIAMTYWHTTFGGRKVESPQLWSRARIRKPTACISCLSVYYDGASMFRPMTNLDNRMHRICGRCMRAIVGGQL